MSASKWFRLSVLAPLVSLLMPLVVIKPMQAETTKKNSTDEKQLIGQTAVVEEVESDFEFPARVDTGATTSSVHVEEWKIEGEAESMAENVGKKIRFCIKNDRGEIEWLERKIIEISVIKTSEQEEQRYKVRLTLNCLDVKKRVLVSLNDRSHMTYPVLLGRNFLQGDFVVDVDLEEDPGQKFVIVKKQVVPASTSKGGDAGQKQEDKSPAQSGS